MVKRFSRKFLPLLLFAIFIFAVACDLHFGALPTPTVSATVPPTPILTVVWTEGGDLFAWRDDHPTPRKIATGAVIQPYLAPDGRHVAFTRGAEGDKSSLWVVGIDGTGEQQVVKPDTIPSIRNGHPQIAGLAWLDNQTIYFNTLQQHEGGSVSDDDLYRAQFGADPQLILPPGAGGKFAISPDGEQIAVIAPGTYDYQQGHVSLLDPLGKTVREVIDFDAVNTANNNPYYPPLQWRIDSSAVYAALPDQERNASDNSVLPATVTLWRASADGMAGRIGVLQSVTLLPDWSADARSLAYVRSGGAARELLIADGDGQNPQVYTSGDLLLLRWLPSGERFAYLQGNDVWIGQSGQPPRKLGIPSDPAENVIFVSADQYVYAAADGLRSGRLDSSDSTLIYGAYAYYDAVLAP